MTRSTLARLFDCVTIPALRRRTVSLWPDPLKDKHSGGEDYPYWQGTAVGIDIGLEAKEEFSTLLELIRGTIVKAIKERKKEIYKKAVFI